MEQRSCDVVLRHHPVGNPSSVAVGGEFNGWTEEALSGPDAEGYWEVDLGALAPGEYAHKFIIDGGWEGDPPASAYAKWLDGSENRDLRVGDCELPLLQVTSSQATASGDITVEVLFARGADGAALDPGSVEATLGGAAAQVQADAQTGELVITASGLPRGKHSLHLRAADVDGNRAENEPLFLPLWVEDTPFDWRDGTMYFAFIDRFRDGDFGASPPLFDPVVDTPERANYMGGDYLGVIQALQEGYFEDLGVGTLWLSPVYENPDTPYSASDNVHNFSGFHGYWPTEARGIESRFGDVDVDSEQRLDELIALAHEQGIRVIFDLVLNHVHEDHEYVSAHPAWFDGGCVCGSDNCGWDDHAVDCWFMPYLPDLNYRNHEVLKQVMEDTLWLTQRFDVDGFRVDAAKHMDHVIMRTLRHRIRDDFERGGGAPFYLVGETFTGDHATIMNYVSDHELSGQFDFPLYFALRNAFAHDGSFNDLESTVDNDLGWWNGAPMSPFLGNHDVLRIATDIAGNNEGAWGNTADWMAGGSSVDQWDIINRISMGLTFTLTQPGVPLLYYGDEIGLAGGEDPDNRRMMSFAPYLSANEEELLSRVQAIGQARVGSEALRRGERVQLWVEQDVLAYALDNGGGDVAIVAMNRGGDRTLDLNVSALGVGGATFTDQIGGGSYTESGGTLSVQLGSWQYLILTR